MVSAISGAMGSFKPQVVSGASMRQPPAQRMANLFDKIDTSGSGTISKAQFEQAFQSLNPPKGLQSMGADATWSQLDPQGNGTVSKQDFVSGMTNILAQAHAHHAHGRADADGDADGSSGAQASSSTASDLTTALRNLEATLGAQPSAGQGSGAGALFTVKA